MVITTDPRVLAIPINDTGEALIDLKDQTTLAYGPSPEIPNNTDYTKLRITVYEKLVKAQSLLPAGLRFCLYEGYRSLALQDMLFQNRLAQNKALHPEWSADSLWVETNKLVAPAINRDRSPNIPPHSTGGTFDVYLIDQENNIVDMGIRVDRWMDDTDGSLSITDAPNISLEAKTNRQIMSNALTAVGFTNMPFEYSHWSYGDRYWAFLNNKPCALYGTIKQ
ncbi:M15 family metallopeptidase [Candidatus Dependentiae bacterium]|nr:M15 family metallopeptidase [Candidatus Dependentiae bacterium]